MWIEAISIFAGVLAIIGVVLNNNLSTHCFHFWIASNTLVCAIHVYAGLWGLAGKDLVFLALAFHGLAKWKNKGARHNKKKESRCST